MKIKLLPLVTLFIILSGNFYTMKAQTRLRDSLKYIISHTHNERTRIDAMNDLAYDLSINDTDSSLRLAKYALDLAKKINYHTGIGKAQMWIGNTKVFGTPRAYFPYLKIAIDEFSKDKNYTAQSVAYSEMARPYYFLSLFDSALYCARRSVEESLKDTSTSFKKMQQLSMAYNQVSNAFYMMSLLDSSYSYAMKALKIAEQIKDPSTIGAAFCSLAGVLIDQAKYELSINYGRQALAYLMKSGYFNMAIVAYTTIAEDYNKLKKKDSARLEINAALALCIKHNLKDNYCTIYWYRGGFQDTPEEELKDYEKALKYAKEDQNVYYENQILFSMAEVFKRLKRTKEALTYANEALAKSNGDISLNMRCYYLLYEIYENAGLYKEALQHHKSYLHMNDSIFNAEKDKTVEEMNTKYSTEKKEHQIELLGKNNEINRKEISKQKLLRNGTLVGMTGLLVFLLVVFLQKKRITKEKIRSEELLLNILPYETAQELKEKGSSDAKLFDEVTVLFTDFKGFTMITEELTPTELVAEIHYCFKTFDNITDRYNIEKIKTIGDAYMAAGGLPVVNKTNATDVVKAAIEIRNFMLEYAAQRKENGKPVFEIRIGVHTGPVVAGIVGVKKFQYDIWGDTVNTASRMESSGEPGKVNISGSTYELVKNKFRCEHRGKVHAKNKGEIDMYFAEYNES